MRNDFTFPLAFCKAQWSVGLHTLAMLETCGAQCLSLGAHMLEDRSAQRRAGSEAVSRAGDWQALTMAAANALWHTAEAPDHPRIAITPTTPRAADTAPSRNAVVQEAVRTLNAALNARASRRPRKGRAGPSRAKA